MSDEACDSLSITTAKHTQMINIIFLNCDSYTASNRGLTMNNELEINVEQKRHGLFWAPNPLYAPKGLRKKNGEL